MKTLYLIGGGMGDEKSLSEKTLALLKSVDICITTQRLAQGLSLKNCQSLLLSDIQPFLEVRGEEFNRVAVIASGDVGYFSIAKSLSAAFSHVEIIFISGQSSLQYFTACLGRGYDDVKSVSLHGREKSLVPFVCSYKKVFALTGGKEKAHDLLKNLCDAGLGFVNIWAGENLGAADQRIIKGTAEEFSDTVFSDLTVLYVENPRPMDRFHKIKDEEFIRGNSPMTKEIIRTIAVAELDIYPHETCVDIGSGTGSVTIAMAQRAYEGRVFALEKNPTALALLKQNIEKFSTFHIIPRGEAAPMGLSGLPTIDKAFIGGSGGNLDLILDLLFNQNENIRVVITVIALETLNRAINYFSMREIPFHVSQVSVNQMENLGNYHMLKPENPIYIITGGKDV